MERQMTDYQIAYHLLFDCIGDHCQCCDWAEGDAAVMAGMSLDTAQHIVDTVSDDGDRSARDYADYEDDRTTFDMSDDADALASAGWGTDEDYGCYGDD